MKTILLSGVLLVAGCTQTHNFYAVVPDFGANTQPDLTTGGTCQPMDVECVGTTSFRECHADGTWGTDIACPGGTVCDQGFCNDDPNSLACNPGEGLCLMGMAYTCRASGVGFDVTTCPSGTTCSGAGACVGACGAVGSSFCLNDPTQIITCDGTLLTQSSCPPAGADGRANLCVTVGNGAKCMPSDCNPATDCDVCGNPADSTVDPAANTSTCTETPAGFRWLSSACSAPTTCDPSANGACFGPQTGAGCDSQCTPGDRRCLAGNRLQTCGSDGTWGTASQCNDAAGESCVSLNGVAVCADPVCTQVARSSAVTGACVLVGNKTQIRTCDPSTGHLVAPEECVTGLCAPVGALTGDGLQPGTCAVECNAGEQQCANGDLVAQGFLSASFSIQSCDNGVWGPPQNCALDAGGGSQCWDFFGGSGQRQAVCGPCMPGGHRCVGAALETCSADGQTWSAGVACTGSTCRDSGGGVAACQADCLPGSLVCAGNPAASPAPQDQGTDAAVTCTGTGTIPVPSCPGPDCCAVGTSCRTDESGNALGCVVCVGGQNEVGLTDTRCSNTAGTSEQDAGPAVQVCNATSNGWLTPQKCGTPTFTCEDPDFNAGTPAFCRDTGLVLYYPFSGDATDHSGNGNDGTLSGNSVPVLTTDACGNPNSAYSFGGQGYIETANNPAFLPATGSARTLTFWFQAAQPSGVGDFVNWGASGTNGHRFGIILDTGAAGYKFVGQGAAFDLNSTDSSMNGDGLWHFAAVTYDGTTVTLYLDNNTPLTKTEALNTGTVNPLEIGTRVGGLDERLVGSVDEVRIYDRALSAAEIATLRALPCP
jgi:Concanavalin A-like lectin/glucanases superfamily